MRAAIATATLVLVVALAAGAAHGFLIATSPVPLVALHGIGRATDRVRARIRQTLEAPRRSRCSPTSCAPR